MSRIEVTDIRLITDKNHSKYEEYKGRQVTDGYVSLIKFVREVNECSLREAKECVDIRRVSIPAEKLDKMREIISHWNIECNYSFDKNTISSPEVAFGNILGPLVREWLTTTGHFWDDETRTIKEMK